MNVLDSIFDNDLDSSSNLKKEKVNSNEIIENTIIDNSNNDVIYQIDDNNNTETNMTNSLEDTSNININIAESVIESKEEEIIKSDTNNNSFEDNADNKRNIDTVKNESINERPDKRIKQNDSYRPSFRCKISFDVRHMTYSEYVEAHYDKMREKVWNENINPQSRNNTNSRMINNLPHPNMMNNPVGYFPHHPSNQMMGMMPNQMPGSFYDMNYDAGRGHSGYFRGMGGRRGGFRGRG